MLTEIEVNKRADEIVDMVLNTSIDFPYVDTEDGRCIGSGYMTYKSAVKIAILHVEKIVEATRDLRSRLTLQPQNWNTVVEYFNEWQQLLQNLKERLKQ